MTRRHAGHYRDKHRSGLTVDHIVKEAVAAETTQQKITCKKAFSIAKRLSVPPATVGVAIDLQDCRIIACQLGLFGHGKEGHNTLNITFECSDALQTAINATSIGGRLSCETAWEIADNIQCRRLDVSQACEAMGIKICNCQLGAF